MKSLSNFQSTTTWRDEVVPGCCFLRFTKSHLALYGEVDKCTGTPGLFHTRAYVKGISNVYESKTHVSDMVILLSKEQMDEARRLNWPSDEDGLQKILFLPAN